MSRYIAIQTFLTEIQEGIDKDKMRDADRTSHRFQDQYDLGYNIGCIDATEEFVDRLLESIKECTKCGKPSFHEDGDYTCIICREQEYQER
jgi:hypothetical protein